MGGMKAFTHWVKTGTEPTRAEVARIPYGDSSPLVKQAGEAGLCSLQFSAEGHLFTIQDQSAETLEKLGYAILEAANQQREADAKRASQALLAGLANGKPQHDPESGKEY